MHDFTKPWAFLFPVFLEMAAINFESWLSEKLKTINVDPEIFGSYIQSILEGEESEKEKFEALQGIFDEEIGNDELINEVLLQWSKLSNLNVNKTESSGGDLDAKLSRIMEEQAKSVVCESSQLTSEEKRLREVILNQYGQISDGEDDAYKDDDPGGVENVAAFGSYSLMSRNTNGEAVMNAEREKREKSKGDHEKKKAQDKLNREKQKQQQQDRKDKEKKRTQKSERKR